MDGDVTKQADLPHASRLARAGEWDTAHEIATVTLPFHDRQRRRILLTCDDGRRCLLNLPEAATLHDGDGLDTGAGVVRVVAAREDVVDIVCRDPVHLARVAWHLGNRHLSVQVVDEARLRIGYDHVIVHMVEGLGAAVARKNAPFDPESGAYAHGGHHHEHGHGHGHGHG